MSLAITPPGGYEWLIILVIILLLFGGAKLPKLARSLGEARREFEKANTDEPEPTPPLTEEELRSREAELARREADLKRAEGGDTP